MSNHPELSSRIATLLKKQAGKCGLCELSFKYGDLWEVDHVVRTSSRGGTDGALPIGSTRPEVSA